MDTHNEKLSQLSLLMDDALDTATAHRVLASMAHDPALAASWRHYHWIRQSLHGGSVLSADVDFAERIHRQLASEPVPHRKNRSNIISLALWERAGVRGAGHGASAITGSRARSNRRREWLKPFGGLALAASLSALAVLGVREYGMAQLPYNLAAGGFAGEPQQAGYGLLSPEKLQEYMVIHNEGIYLIGAGDMLPQARVVSFVNP